MGALLSFFAGGPARMQALVYAAGVLLLALATAVSIALWYRGEALQARGQAQLLQHAVDACREAVALTKRTSDAALQRMATLADAAARATAGTAQQVQRLDAHLRRPPPRRPDGKPAGCDDGWDVVEREARQ
jgi:hypothetical protein